MAKEQDTQELSLDNLDDINLGETDINLDDIDLEGVGEVDEVFEVPHIKVSSKSLKEFLVVAKQLCSASGKDYTSKSVSFSVENGVVKARATDFESYIEKDLQLLNEEHVYDKPIVIPVDDLIKLVKAVPVNTVFFEEDHLLKIKLIGGALAIATYNIGIEKFIYADELAPSETVQAKELNKVLKDFSGIMNQAVSPVEKRIYVGKEKSYVSYLFSTVAAKAALTEMDLKSKDVNVIRSLIALKEEQLSTFDTAPAVKVKRKVIQGSDFRYAFLNTELKVPAAFGQMIEKADKPYGVYVDYVTLAKMAQLIAELPYSLGRIGFNYTEDGAVILEMKTKNNKDKPNKFTLTGANEGECKPLPETVMIQARTLTILLRSFASSASVKVTISTEGLGLSDDSYIGFLGKDQSK